MGSAGTVETVGPVGPVALVLLILQFWLYSSSSISNLAIQLLAIQHLSHLPSFVSLFFILVTFQLAVRVGSGKIALAHLWELRNDMLAGWPACRDFLYFESV